MKFKIEQIAIAPSLVGNILAKDLLTDMGATYWHEDAVGAQGVVYNSPGSNLAGLSFNYDLGDKGSVEFEILNYISGPNWLADKPKPCISHLGMHCTEKELLWWKEFFDARDIPIAQEVHTKSHTNPVIKNSRRYHYCIFDTRAILGLDIKFIVRREFDESPSV